jgi:hypothetical protein
MPAEVDVPPELAAICARALAPEPADRYATAQEFQQDLEQYLATWSDRIGAVQLSAYMREIFSQERESAKWLIESHIRETKKLEDTVAGQTRAGAPQSQSQPQSPTQPAPPRRRSKWVGFIALPGVVVVASMLLLAGVFAGGRRTSWEAERTTATRSPAGRPGADESCKSGSKACDGACVSVDSPERGCGGEGCNACNVSNATARCNQFDLCDVAVCHKGFQDCDSDGSNGCEANVRTDPDNCGDCGRRCLLIPHAQRGCGDVCTIWRCMGGFRDCNAQVDDGCEVDVMNDQRNCGRCGHGCAHGQKCHRGVCA